MHPEGRSLCSPASNNKEIPMTPTAYIVLGAVLAAVIILLVIVL